jgi:hypothetical protein
MLFFGIKNLWFRLGVFLVLTIWTALLIGLMYRNYFVFDPFNPELTGTAAYGHNGEDAFKSYAVLTLIEYLVLLAVFLPYSFSRYYWIRPLLMQFFFGFWFFVMAITGMHGGGVHGLHALWLLGINGIISILLVATIVAEAAGRNVNRAIQNQQWNNQPNN